MTPSFSAAAFVAGMLSFLSPCVLPLVPGYISMVSGVSVQELRKDSRATGAVTIHALMFIVGFSVVFIALGAAASAIGELAGRHMTLFNRIAGVVIILFGLHLLGITPIRALYADRRLGGAPAHPGATRAFVLGFAFAFGWTPCVGPILAGILALAASEATWQTGTGLLAVYSAGLALPFLLTAVGVDRFLATYARFRHHLRKIEVAAGCLLILIGSLVFTRHLALVNSWLSALPFVQTMAEHFL